MGARIATALIGIPVVFYAACAASLWPLRVFLAAIGILGLYEFVRTEARPNAPYWAWLLGVGFVAALAVWFPAQASSPWILALLLIPALAILVKDLPPALVASGWILLPLLSAVSLRAPSVPEPQHLGLALHGNVLIIVILCLWAGDSFAYFIGSAFGKHKLAPSISPGKSWEGAIANLAACVIVGWALADPLGLPGEFGLGLGALCGVLGQVGDLFQSAWKRRHETKDSGSLLPGHGGVLDRFDSLLFCLPAANAIAYIWRV